MIERAPNGERMWYCPLLRLKVEEGLCVDIYEAAYGWLKKSAVPEVTDWKAVEKICPRCRRFFENDEEIRLGD